MLNLSINCISIVFTILFPKCIQSENEHCTFRNVIKLSTLNCER